MSLNEYKATEGFGFCEAGQFPDDCDQKRAVDLYGASTQGSRLCFRHAFAAALASEPEAQAMAMVWATNEIERLQEARG